MPESEPGSRMLAHRAAVIIGIVSGFLLFRLGLQALFSVNSRASKHVHKPTPQHSLDEDRVASVADRRRFRN